MERIKFRVRSKINVIFPYRKCEISYFEIFRTVINYEDIRMDVEMCILWYINVTMRNELE